MIAATHDRGLPPQPVASGWHTTLLITLFLALAVAGALFQRQAVSRSGAPSHPDVVPLYLSLLVAEWGLFLYVRKGALRQTGTTLGELIGGQWRGPQDVLVDAGLALGVWAVWRILDAGWERWLGPGHAASIQPFLPRRAVEILLWIALSISAGICEELAFRGYLQRQFAALTHRPWLGVGLQAALFGIAHGYQGIQASLKIAVYGALFGLLALWRRSLRPGMIAHASTDLQAALFGI